MIYKILVIMLFIFYYATGASVLAMDIESNDDTSKIHASFVPTQSFEEIERENSNYIKNLPPELVLTITNHLQHDPQSLLAFARTDHSYYGLIMGYEPYTSPRNQQAIITDLEKTPFHQIRFLICLWKKGDIKTTCKLLNHIKEGYLGYCAPFLRQAFQTYLKALNCSRGLGDENALDAAKDLYHTIQVELEKSRQVIGPNEEHILDPKKFVLHSKSLSLLDVGLRTEIAQNYEIGKHPFESNPLKAGKYRALLHLPISF